MKSPLPTTLALSDPLSCFPATINVLTLLLQASLTNDTRSSNRAFSRTRATQRPAGHDRDRMSLPPKCSSRRGQPSSTSGALLAHETDCTTVALIIMHKMIFFCVYRQLRMKELTFWAGGVWGGLTPCIINLIVRNSTRQNNQPMYVRVFVCVCMYFFFLILRNSSRIDVQCH